MPAPVRPSSLSQEERRGAIAIAACFLPRFVVRGIMDVPEGGSNTKTTPQHNIVLNRRAGPGMRRKRKREALRKPPFDLDRCFRAGHPHPSPHNHQNLFDATLLIVPRRPLEKS